jgi:hypothetical protein
MIPVRRFFTLVFVLATFVVANVVTAPDPRAFAQSSAEPDSLVHGDPAMPPDDSDRLFLQLLKDAVANDRRAWVADQVSYPIRVAVSGKQTSVRTKDDFLAHYDDIINERVRNAILEQRFEDLFKNWHGTAIGPGLVWFGGIGKAKGCDRTSRLSPDQSAVFTCVYGDTFRVMIRAINNDFNPATGLHDGG